MSTERDMAAMRRVIAMTGLSFPRGLLGPEAMQLAAAIGGGVPDRAEVDALIRQVATVQWPGAAGASGVSRPMPGPEGSAGPRCNPALRVRGEGQAASATQWPGRWAALASGGAECRI